METLFPQKKIFASKQRLFWCSKSVGERFSLSFTGNARDIATNWRIFQHLFFAQIIYSIYSSWWMGLAAVALKDESVSSIGRSRISQRRGTNCKSEGVHLLFWQFPPLDSPMIACKWQSLKWEFHPPLLRLKLMTSVISVKTQVFYYFSYRRKFEQVVFLVHHATRSCRKHYLICGKRKFLGFTDT